MDQNLITFIYASDCPFDLNLREPTWDVGLLKIMKEVLRSSPFSGRISISRNMLIKEFLKSNEPIQLYIYEITTQKNVGIFRFQGVCNGMAMAMDGFIIGIS
jgi:hypothetical protein